MSPRDSYYPVVLVFVVLDSLAVALRLWMRYVRNTMGYDDLALAVSLVRYPHSPSEKDFNKKPGVFTVNQFGFLIFGALELAAINYGIGATEMNPVFDPIKAAMVSF